MKYLIFLLIFIGLSSTPLHSATQNAGSGIRESSPCGATLLELDSLTNYWQRMWQAEYKDFTPAEITHFLEKKKIGRSDIAGVRVFRSNHHNDHAIIVYFLFENTLGGKPLVSINCVIPINSSPGLVSTPSSLQELMGKSYEELGK